MIVFVDDIIMYVVK